MSKTYYHTQESRKVTLTEPQKCIREDAWLGDAFYFWADEFDAHQWGHNSKNRMKFFEIYSCSISSEKIIDTVFNEEHYYFWLKQIEKIAKKIIVSTSEKPTIKELNDYIVEKKVWQDNVDAIQFQDLPTNNEHLLIKPIEYKNKKLRSIAYRKRIQLAIYNQNIIRNFALHTKERVL